jgi:anti-sigma B factor antagonist
MTAEVPPSGAAEEFSVSTEEGANGAIVRVRGEIDMSTCPALRDELYRLAAARAPRVVVDMSQTTFIDSAGLGVLVGALKRMREHGGRLELRSLEASTRKVFEITGLTDVFLVSD